MKKIFLILVVLLAVFIGFKTVFSSSTAISQDKSMKAHLTIYIEDPVYDTGGTVIVAANEIPLEEWNAIPRDGNNPARDDKNNKKREALGEDDRLFGVTTSNQVTIIEMVYPEGGTYGFNLVAVPSEKNTSPQLKSKKILVGSGGYTIWDTGRNSNWQNVSVVHIYGNTFTEDNSREVDPWVNNIMNLYPKKEVFLGATMHKPTQQELEKAIVKIKGTQ